MVKQLVIPFVATAAFIVVVGFLAQGKIGNLQNNFFLSQPSPAATTAKTVKISGSEINVEIAKTKEERSIGLSKRESLDQNSGMLFVFDGKSSPSFWMKDTKISLDIIWIKDGKITKIEKNVKPEIGKNDSELTIYPAPGNTDYVLEVNAGYCLKNNIKIGDSITIPSI